MSNTPHELTEDFPGQDTLIHDLKQTDMHFRGLTERYHEVNRGVHRAETNVEPMDQFAEEALRKERVQLKDQIAAVLSAAAG